MIHRPHPPQSLESSGLTRDRVSRAPSQPSPFSAEHERPVQHVLATTGKPTLLADYPVPKLTQQNQG